MFHFIYKLQKFRYASAFDSIQHWREKEHEQSKQSAVLTSWTGSLLSSKSMCLSLSLSLPLPLLLPLVDTGSLFVGFKLINLILVSDRTKMNSFS